MFTDILDRKMRNFLPDKIININIQVDIYIYIYMRVHKYSIFIMNRRVICCMLQKILVFIIFQNLKAESSA